jgi:ribose transport system permease protein
VLGGASLAGGSGSVLGTAIGAVFLIQLQQDVFGAGAPQSVQYLIQAGVIAMAMALRTLIGRLNAGRAHSPGSEPTLGAPLSAATG